MLSFLTLHSFIRFVTPIITLHVFFLYFLMESSYFFILERIHNVNLNSLFFYVIILLVYLTITKSVNHSFLVTLFIFFSYYFYSNHSGEPNLFIINDRLINGLFSIHPVLVYTTLSFFFFISIFSSFTEYPNTFYSRKVIAVILLVATLALYLGSWWALQEVAWGGWWNWDFIEVVNLVVVFTLFLKTHRYSFFIPSNFKTAVFSLVLFLLNLIASRYSLISSVHSFSNTTSYFLVIFVLIFLLLYAFFVANINCLLRNKHNIDYTSAISLYVFIFFFLTFIFLMFSVSSISRPLLSYPIIFSLIALCFIITNKPYLTLGNFFEFYLFLNIRTAIKSISVLFHIFLLWLYFCVITGAFNYFYFLDNFYLCFLNFAALQDLSLLNADYFYFFYENRASFKLYSSSELSLNSTLMHRHIQQLHSYNLIVCYFILTSFALVYGVCWMSLSFFLFNFFFFFFFLKKVCKFQFF